MNKASGKEVQDNYNLLTDIWEDRHLQPLSFGIDGEHGETAESSGTSDLDEASEGK